MYYDPAIYDKNALAAKKWPDFFPDHFFLPQILLLFYKFGCGVMRR